MESSEMTEHAPLANPPVAREPTQSHLGSRLSRTTAFLFALFCGLAVANVYCAQPLLDAMAADFGISHAVVGLVGRWMRPFGPVAAVQSGHHDPIRLPRDPYRPHNAMACRWSRRE